MDLIFMIQICPRARAKVYSLFPALPANHI